MNTKSNNYYIVYAIKHKNESLFLSAKCGGSGLLVKEPNFKSIYKRRIDAEKRMNRIRKAGICYRGVWIPSKEFEIKDIIIKW